MNSIKKIYVFFLLGFIYPQGQIEITHLTYPDYNSIYLNLESHSQTIYLINILHPNVTNDIDYLGFYIDGSMMYPLYNSIPHNKFITANDSITMSQLSVIQDHSTFYYDTNGLLQFKLRKKINFLGQFESKSLQKNNYDQKLMVSFYKEFNKSNVDIGYMYHYEKIPTYISEIRDYYKRGLEAFSSKLIYTYSYNAIQLENRFNSQMTNYNRYNLNYLTNTNWNKLILNYSFTSELTVILKSAYKYTVSNNDDITFINNNFHKISIGMNYKINNHNFDFGIDKFKKDSYYFIKYGFSIDKYALFLLKENNPIMNIQTIDNVNKMNKFIYENKQIGIVFNNKLLEQSISLGKFISLNYAYKYFLLKTTIKYQWLHLDVIYGKYDSNRLFVKYFIRSGITISPNIKNKRYRPYLKIRANNVSINSRFDITHSNLTFIQQHLNENQFISSIKTIDGEIGILFKSFKIAFIKENMFKDYYYYSQEYIMPNMSNYLINIVWLFKE